MIRVIFVFALTGILGVGIAFGISALAGLISTSLRFPVFVIVLVWWVWIGWKYAKARQHGEF
jgi:hypothetical protein